MTQQALIRKQQQTAAAAAAAAWSWPQSILAADAAGRGGASGSAQFINMLQRYQLLP